MKNYSKRKLIYLMYWSVVCSFIFHCNPKNGFYNIHHSFPGQTLLPSQAIYHSTFYFQLNIKAYKYQFVVSLLIIFGKKDIFYQFPSGCYLFKVMEQYVSHFFVTTKRFLGILSSCAFYYINMNIFFLFQVNLPLLRQPPLHRYTCLR